MAAVEQSPILGFLLGRVIAERLGLGTSLANQWGGVQAAFGVNAPGVLVVAELARQDALEQGAQSGSLHQEIRALAVSVQALAAGQARTEQAVLRVEQVALQSAACCAETLAAAQ